METRTHETTAEQHVRNIIRAVAPWDVVGFGPDRFLSAGELVGGANYLRDLLRQVPAEASETTTPLADQWIGMSEAERSAYLRQTSEAYRQTKEFVAWADRMFESGGEG